MKQAIIIRTDLKMDKGKIAAQAAHASLGAVKKARKSDIALWERQGGKKIVLKVGSLRALKSLYRKAKSDRLPCFLVRDAGLTQVEGGSLTTVGIGPTADRKVDKIIKNLKLL
jgi:PTH2 family peptidyl-tRNA hydrolase